MQELTDKQYKIILEEIQIKLQEMPTLAMMVIYNCLNYSLFRKFLFVDKKKKTSICIGTNFLNLKNLQRKIFD